MLTRALKSVSSTVASFPLRLWQLGGLVLCGLVGLPAPSVQAQVPAAVEGQVVDAQSGDPLTGANLKVIGAQRGTTTDAEGRFELSVPPGRLTLRASFVGYASLRKEIEVEAGETTTVRFQLQPGSTLDNVVVVGTRGQARSALRSAAPVDAIQVNELAAESPQTGLNQLLNYTVPSFQVNRQSSADATEFSDPATMRSLPPDQLLVLVNGKRRHESSLVNTLETVGQGAAGTDLNAIPDAAVQQIEVLRNGASAQYGSDAIAGVINLQMREATSQLVADVTTGVRNEGDGEVVKISANYGFGIGEDGFVNVTGMFQDRARTNRADGNELIIFDQSDRGNFFAYPFADDPEQARQIDNQILQRRGLERDDVYYRIGQSAIQQGAVFLNSEFDLQEGATLYAFGSLSYKNGIGAPFRRRPSALASMPFRASTQDTTLFKNGFQPEMNSDVIDQSLTLGVKGTIGGWQWDLSNSLGRNSLDYQMDNTVNASLLQASPTSIYAGKHALSQNVASLDASQFFDDALAGASVAFGGAYRIDHYQIFAGEEASYRDYGRATLIDNSGSEPEVVTRDTLGKEGGSQGFVGFRPENEVDRTRSNVAAYLDTEINLTEQLLVTAAGRFENYSDFGSTFNGRLAARLGLLDGRLNLRGSASTGFRAPSLHQIYFNQVETDINSEGELVNVGIFSNDSEVARVLDIPDLEEERSRSVNAGLTASPTESLDLTIDAYGIRIDDRVVLTGEFPDPDSPDPEVVDLLSQVGAQNAQLFANGADTETIGLDVVATYQHRTDFGDVELSASGNYNDTDIRSINVPGELDEDQRNVFLGRQQQGLITESNPRTKVNLSADYETGPFSLLLRTVRFGEYIRAGFAKDQVQSPEWVVDATASYDVTDAVTLSVGANNLFNNYPDQQVDDNSFFGVFDYAPVQQGFNGAFYFARLSVQL